MKPDKKPASLDYYSRLGLTREATSEEVRRAYHHAARRYHPDVCDKAGSTQEFFEIQKAYEVLSDAQRRNAYDSTYVDQAPILLRLLYSRKALPRLKEPQLVYVLFEMSPHPDKVNHIRSSALNMCLVIDRSTSMKGERMDLVKESAMDLMRMFGPESTLSIVAFSDRAEVLIPAGEQFDPEKSETKIRTLQASGGTEIYRGLEAAYHQIRRSPMLKGLAHILLLTDGHTYGDEHACFDLAEKAAQEGIGITALGIGNEWNISFLESLATRTGGRCIYISNPTDIGKLMLEKVRSLGQVYATNLQMDMQIGKGVTLRFAFRLMPESSALDSVPPLRLGNLFKHSSVQVLLEFCLDPIGAEVSFSNLAKCHLKAEFPNGALPRFKRFLLLGRPISDSPERENHLPPS